jgi:short subunit dehydrogenase-like uncharacterized protein
MNEVFKAIYDKLTADLSVSVYDHVPQDLPESDYPFVRIDYPNLNDDDTDLELAWSGDIQIITYSRYRGIKEIADLTDAVYNSLHRISDLQTTNYTISNLVQSFISTVTEPDGLTRHGVQRFTLEFEKVT